MAHSIDASTGRPDGATPPSAARHKAAWVALAVGAGIGTWALSPSTSFQARAVVGITDVTSPVASILSRTAAETAVSKPVMTRAAESLIGTGFPAPEPDLAERAALAAHLGGAKVTGKNARLAADLPRLVTARPGETPGSLEIIASTIDADRAMQVASAVADALITDQDETIAKARRKHDLDITTRLDRLKTEAVAARRRLAALGGLEADPLQALATATTQTARAQARVNTINAIIASGSPPLSDRRDVPSAIETLQASYLDLARQLAKARETLGERHSTVIALNAELRHARSSLTAEWRRLGRMAEAELATARERETALRKGDVGLNAARRQEIDEARRALQLADDSVARALAVTRDTAVDERGYRLLLHPTMPNAPTGFTPVMRTSLAGLVGILVISLGAFLRRRRATQVQPAQVVVLETGNARRHEAFTNDTVEDAGDELRHEPESRERALQDGAQTRFEPPAPVDDEADSKGKAGDSLMQAMSDLVPQLEALDPGFGPVPTVMVAANETIAETSRVALALGRAAASRGHRVLLIEALRSRPSLAAAAEPDADPILVDFFGTLRVALRAAPENGDLFLAPNLHQGARIASALARDGETPLVDDIGAEFDLVVIDGGRVADAAAAGWGADAHLRVGRYRSKRDDDQFASILGVPEILGAVVASAFSKTPAKPMHTASHGGTSNARSSQRVPSAPNTVASGPVRQAPPRRRIGAR